MTTDDFISTMKMAPGTTTNKMISEMAGKIAGEHRTNQASIIRNLQHLMVAYSQMNPGSDPRNEMAVQLAEHVACIDISIPYV